MKTIYMDITDPDWIYADDAIRRWKAEGNPSMVTYWEGVKARSLKLRDEIIETVESEGARKLSWYSGKCLHEKHAKQWEEAMPEYQFEIGNNYECIVRKRGE